MAYKRRIRYLTKNKERNNMEKVKKQLIDLRMDYDELSDWVSQIHHKLDYHIRECDGILRLQREKTLSSKIKNFFNKYRDVFSVLLGISILLTIIVLSSLRICGII
jgi:Na+/phosphate symporter